MTANRYGHEVPSDVVAEVGHGQDRQRTTLPSPLLDDIGEVGENEPDGVLPGLLRGRVLAGRADRADDDPLDPGEDLVAPEGREQAVEVLDVDLDVLEKENVAFPAELGGNAAVEKIDERREVAAEGDPGKPARRGRGQPGRAAVMDLVPADERQQIPEVALTDLEGGEVDDRDAAGMIDLVEEKGEIGEADEQGRIPG